MQLPGLRQLSREPRKVAQQRSHKTTCVCGNWRRARKLLLPRRRACTRRRLPWWERPSDVTSRRLRGRPQQAGRCSGNCKISSRCVW